jgi:hypothetical protein
MGGRKRGGRDAEGVPRIYRWIRACATESDVTGSDVTRSDVTVCAAGGAQAREEERAREIERRMKPQTAADFEILYRELAAWQARAAAQHPALSLALARRVFSAWQDLSPRGRRAPPSSFALSLSLAPYPRTLPLHSFPRLSPSVILTPSFTHPL